MTQVTSTALFFLSAGIFTSVTLLSAYQIFFAISILYFGFKAYQQKQFQLSKSTWFLLAFVAVAFLSLIVNYEFLPRPSKSFGKLKYYLLGAFGVFALKVWIKDASDKVKKYVVHTFLLSIILAAGFGSYKYFMTDNPRVNGFTDTMRYGYGTGMALLLIISAILHKEQTQKWMNSKFAIFAFVIGFIGMYLTYTRGALLGFLCGLPFAIYFYKQKLGLIIGGVSFVLVILLAGIYLFGPADSGSRFLLNKNNSGDIIRRSQWEAAVYATKEKPILGWGLSNFHSQVKRIKQRYRLKAKSYDNGHAHNNFLEVASGTGLLGLFFFLMWLFTWAHESTKRKGLTRALIIPFWVAFIVSGLFEVTLDANNASMILFLYALSGAPESNV